MSTPRPTRVEEVAATLRDRILSGTLAEGSPLREETLAQEFGVSRHTVRAALAALRAERLASAEPYRGVRVARLDDAALLSLQDLRRALEGEAVRILRGRHGDEWPEAVLEGPRTALLALQRACTQARDSRTGWLAVERAHTALHHALVAAAGSPRLTETHDALVAELDLVLLHLDHRYPDPALLVEEHRDYLDAVRVDGPDAVAEHLDASARSILAARHGRAQPPGPHSGSTETPA